MLKTVPIFSEIASSKANASSGSKTALGWLPYVLACSLLSIFRMGGLTHQSLWFDEGYTLNLASTQNFKEFLHLFGSYTTSEHLQSLYYLGMFAWSRFAGTSDFALRLPSALFSIGSGLCLLAVVRRFTRHTGYFQTLLCLAVFSVSSYSVAYAQEARPYACLQFFSFAFLTAWLYRSDADVRWNGRNNSHVQEWIFAAAAALVSLTSVFGVLLVIAVATADLWWNRHALRSWWSLWKAPAAGSATAMLLYAVFAKLAFPSIVASDIVAAKQPLWMNVAYMISGILFGTTLGPSAIELHATSKLHLLVAFLPLLLPAALVIAGLGSVLYVLTVYCRSVPKAARICASAAAIYAALLLLVFGKIGHLNVLPRHASSLFALLTVAVAGCALSEPAWRQRHPIVARVLVASIAGAFVLNCISMYRAIYVQDYRKDNYRAVAEAMPRDETPTFLTAGQAELLQHYGLSVRSMIETAPGDLADHLRLATSDAPQVRVVTNLYRNFRWDQAPSVEAELRPAYVCEDEAHYADFNILLCRLTKGDIAKMSGPPHAQ